MTVDPDSGTAPPPARASGAPARLGAVALLLLALGTLVITGYTYLDIPVQQRLGAWNYLAALTLLLATGIPLRMWRPDPRPRSATSPDDGAREASGQTSEGA